MVAKKADIKEINTRTVPLQRQGENPPDLFCFGGALLLPADCLLTKRGEVDENNTGYFTDFNNTNSTGFANSQ